MHEWPTTKDSNTLPFSITGSVTVETMLKTTTLNMATAQNVGSLTKTRALEWGKIGQILFIASIDLVRFTDMIRLLAVTCFVLFETKLELEQSCTKKLDNTTCLDLAECSQRTVFLAVSIIGFHLL